MTEPRMFAFVTRQLVEDTEHGYTTPSRSYFKTFGLHTGDAWSPFDYLDWITDRQAEFNELVRKAGDRPKDFWGSFDEWLLEQADGITYTIYQPEQEHFNIPLSGWKKMGLTPTDFRYEPVWTGKVESPDMDAAAVMEAFKKNIPRAYKGRKFQVGT